jgi:hypothetical protein
MSAPYELPDIPAFLRVSQEERRAAWAANPPRESVRALPERSKADTATASASRTFETEDTMARKAEKQVTTRFKKTAPKAAPKMSKPRAARAPRASSHTVSLTGKVAELRDFISGHGATLIEVCKKFDWQPHSARAAISRLNGKNEVDKTGRSKTDEIIYKFVPKAAPKAAAK